MIYSSGFTSVPWVVSPFDPRTGNWIARFNNQTALLAHAHMTGADHLGRLPLDTFTRTDMNTARGTQAPGLVIGSKDTVSAFDPITSSTTPVNTKCEARAP